MNDPIKKREKRYGVNIGKESDDLIKKMQAVLGNKKLTKKELIYRALEACYIWKLDLSEVVERPVVKKDLDQMKNEFTKVVQGYSNDISDVIKLVEEMRQK